MVSFVGTNVSGKWKTPVRANRMWEKVEEYERSGEADRWVGAAMESHFVQVSSDLDARTYEGDGQRILGRQQALKWQERY